MRVRARYVARRGIVPSRVRRHGQWCGAAGKPCSRRRAQLAGGFELELRQDRAGKLGGPGKGGQLILEGFFGGAVAEAAPGCRVERGHDAGKVVLDQLGQVVLAW